MKLTTFAAAMTLALTLATSAQAASFGSNLIINGDAEASIGSPNGGPVAVPGWTTTAGFTAVNYGASGGFPSITDAGPVNRGLTFFGSNGAVLSSANLAPVFAGERGNLTGLLLRDTQGFIPAGALSVSIGLNMTRNEGSYNDGYADNLSFSIAAPVPEADTYAMLLGGLALLGVVARRKNRAKA